ncbi:MAG TPA: IS1380 family transposase [Kofleriaceae bacterium]|nr:IS1380 family transposase [Kofleriaceae bacterium]
MQVSLVAMPNEGPNTPTTDCISPIELQLQGRRVQVVGDAPAISSDGGVLLLRQVDEHLRLTGHFARLLPDDRAVDRVRHSREEQLRQRVYQICLGYEDCNDADRLRTDPALRLACGAEDIELSSQPTLSRFENAITGRELNQLWREYERQYVAALDPATTLVVLDIDSTDDPTHGSQQLAFFHGFYDQHMFHPLLVFDATTGQLITALLRPGRAHAARGAISILTRLIRAIRTRCPDAAIVVRGDSAFAMPRLLERLEHLAAELGGVDYVIGLATNSRLLAMAEPLRTSVAEQFVDGGQFVRRFTWISYAAASWPAERNVVVKVEHSSRGENPRFVVTTLNGFAPELIYDAAYCPRGQSENFIKDLKNALGAERLSCHRFIANAFRLFLHALAYRLMHALRVAVAKVAPVVTPAGESKALRLAAAQMDTLRLRLLKVAAVVVSSVRRVLVHLPRSFPLAGVFLATARALGAA